MHYIFLINYFANRKKAADLENAILEFSKGNNWDIQIYRTEYPGHAQELAAQFADRYRSEAIIFACGGDGTVHEVANALAFGQTPMAVLPMGTGNDLARSVLQKEYCENPSLVISKINSYEIRPIDLIRVDCFDSSANFMPEISRYSINITSFGLDTMVNDTAKKMIQKSKRNGIIRKNAYTLAILKCFIKGWNFKMRYSFELAGRKETADGELDFCLSCICNGNYYGNGFCPAPLAKIDDGILEVCLVEDLPRMQAIPLVGKYKKGKHLGHPKVHSYQVTSGVLSSLDSHSQIRGNYDGEDFSAHQVRFEVVPGAVPFAFFSI